MDDRPYYYRLRGRTMGPVGLRQVRQLAARAQIGRTTDVSRDGLQWAKAGDFPEIFEAESAAANPGGFGGGGGGAGDAGWPDPGVGGMTAATQWYYTLNGTPQGPVDQATLQQLVASGRVPQHENATPVGGSTWTPIHSLPQLTSSGGGGGSGPIINVHTTSGPGGQSEDSNGMAIAGFVLSFFCAPLGLILSLVALNGKSKANRGLAIAGAIIGGLLTLCGCGYFFIVFLAVAANA